MNVTFRCIVHQSSKPFHSPSNYRKLLTLSPLTTDTHSQHQLHTQTHLSHKHQSSKNYHHLNASYFDATRSFANDAKHESDSHHTSTSTDTDKIDRRAYPIAFSSLLMGIGIGVILPVMPQFANEVGINTMQYGFVISVMGITRLIVNIPAGLLTDKFGRKFTLVGGPIISSIGTLVMATATTLNEMISSRFFTGAGGSLQMAGAQAYLSDISTIRNRARTMAPLMIGFSAGASLGPFIGGFLCDYYDSARIPFYFVSAAIGAVAVNNMYSLPETLAKEKRVHKNITEVLSNMKKQWKYLCTNRSHMSGVMVHAAFWLAQAGSTFTLMPLLATNELGVTATQIGGIFAMMSVVNICGAQLCAKLSDKFGRKKVIVPAICIISSTIPLIPHVVGLHQLYGLMFVYSIGSTMLGTSPTAYIADLHSGDKEKEQHRTQALAMLRSGGDCGLMLGSGLLGYLMHATGSFTYPMCTASVILFAAGANFAINAKETVHHR